MKLRHLALAIVVFAVAYFTLAALATPMGLGADWGALGTEGK